jgi:3-deoxy-D-manno-octulosonate 8-phosphate phosphatase (KDO 8-P phosphatase)
MIRDNLVLKKKLGNIKLLLVNCEGVLTDGSYYLMENGEVARKFTKKDELGIKLIAEKIGVDLFLLSTEESFHFKKLAINLELSDHYLIYPQKISALEFIKTKYKVDPEQIAYIGCDIDDLQLMHQVGLILCPLDATYEVMQKADYVCNTCGGNGVLREIADLFSLTNTSTSISA